MLFICLSLKLWVLCDEVALGLVFIIAAASVVVVVFTVVVVVLVIVFNFAGRSDCALVGVCETFIAPGVRGYQWRPKWMPEQYVHQLREPSCSLCPAKQTGWYWQCRCVEAGWCVSC